MCGDEMEPYTAYTLDDRFAIVAKEVCKGCMRELDYAALAAYLALQKLKAANVAVAIANRVAKGAA